MSIFKNSTSITRYDVSGLPEVDGKDIIQAVLDNLNANKIFEIEVGEDMSWGWTNILVPFIPKFDDISFMTGDYITIGMRIDRKKIPSATLKKEIFLAEEKEKEEKQLPKLSRATKVMIKEAVIKNLLAKAPSVPASYDIVWNVSEQKLFLMTTNSLARNVLEDLIKESFDLDIRMIFPFTMALNSDVKEDDIARIQPTSFV